MPGGAMREKAVGAALFLAGLVLGALGARLLGPERGGPVGIVRPGPGDNPRIARKVVPGGSLYFVEGQEGLVFVPDPPR